MKRSWQPEELIEHWTLIPTELDLLTKKTATNRLGIALLLKYFQYEGRFPTSKAEVGERKKLWGEIVVSVFDTLTTISNLNLGAFIDSGRFFD